MTQHIVRSRGIALIESAAATCVAGLLTSGVLPSFSAALEQQQLTAAAHELVTTLNIARAEARTRNQRTAVAPLDTSNWSHGWHAFVDSNDDGQWQPTETVLHESSGTPTAARVQTSFGSSSGQALSFDPAGQLRRPGSNGLSNGLLLGRVSLELGDSARTLCFSANALRVAKAASCS